MGGRLFKFSTQLPWRFELGLNFSYSSAPPFSAFVVGIDFSGDGTTNDLLPGTTVNAFNRGLGRADLAQLVDKFNQPLPVPRTLKAVPFLASRFRAVTYAF